MWLPLLAVATRERCVYGVSGACVCELQKGCICNCGQQAHTFIHASLQAQSVLYIHEKLAAPHAQAGAKGLLLQYITAVCCKCSEVFRFPEGTTMGLMDCIRCGRCSPGGVRQVHNVDGMLPLQELCPHPQRTSP